jgi:hypothetical protein
MGDRQKFQPDARSLGTGTKGVLAFPSYFLLDDDARKLVDTCASDVSLKEDPDDFSIDLSSAILNRRSLEQALDEGEDFLRTLDPARFLIQAKAKDGCYNAELDVIEGKLKLLNYLVMMSFERAKETQNLPALPEYRAYFERVGRMLAALQCAKQHAEDDTEPVPLEGPKTAGDGDAPLRYFGMRYIVPAVEAAVVAMTLNRVENWHAIPASFNDLRLYLVWANALSQCICNMISESLQVTLTVTQAVLNDLAFATGSLGFILYFTTFGIAASIVLQNTLDLGLTKKVRKLELSFNERFKAQWDERKFLMLNNAVWGVVNFVCFFWLVGKNTLGFWGNILTDALLVADLFLVCWQFNEAETEHQARLKFYDEGIHDLDVKIEALEKLDKPMYLARLQLERDALDKAQKKIKQNWTYKIDQHRLQLMYGIGVIIGFTVLCSFFFPPAIIVPVTGVILALVGAAMCFGLGVTYKALSGSVIVQKEKDDLKASRTEYKVALKRFHDVSVDLKASPDDNTLQTESKLLYLSLKKSVATQAHQTQAVDYQKAQIICNVLTDLILPSIFVLAFVFMPLGIGMPIFAVGLVALFYANWQVAEMAPEGQKPELFASLDKFGTWLFSGEKPEQKGLEQFDEQAYEQFCQGVGDGRDPAVILIEQLKPNSPKASPDLPSDDICPEGVK